MDKAPRPDPPADETDVTGRALDRPALIHRPTGAGDPDSETGPRSTLFGYIWSVSWRQQIVIVMLAGVVALLELAPIELQRRIIDGAVASESIAALLSLAAVYLAVLITHGLLKHGLRVYRGMVSEDVLRASRERIFRLTDGQAGRDGPGEVEADGGGTRVSVLGPEVEELGTFAGSAFADAAVNGFTIIGVAVYMVLTEPILAAASLMLLVPQAMVVPPIQARINALAGTRVGHRRRLNDAVIGGDSDRFVHLWWELRCLGANVAWWKSLARLAVNGLNALGPLTVLTVGGYLVIVGETSLGVVVAFLSGFQRLADPARDLLDFYRAASLTATRYRLVGDWLHRRPQADRT